MDELWRLKDGGKLVGDEQMTHFPRPDDYMMRLANGGRGGWGVGVGVGVGGQQQQLDGKIGPRQCSIKGSA